MITKLVSMGHEGEVGTGEIQSSVTVRFLCFGTEANMNINDVVSQAVGLGAPSLGSAYPGDSSLILSKYEVRHWQEESKSSYTLRGTYQKNARLNNPPTPGSDPVTWEAVIFFTERSYTVPILEAVCMDALPEIGVTPPADFYDNADRTRIPITNAVGVPVEPSLTIARNDQVLNLRRNFRDLNEVRDQFLALRDTMNQTSFLGFTPGTLTFESMPTGIPTREGNFNYVPTTIRFNMHHIPQDAWLSIANTTHMIRDQAGKLTANIVDGVEVDMPIKLDGTPLGNGEVAPNIRWSPHMAYDYNQLLP